MCRHQTQKFRPPRCLSAYHRYARVVGIASIRHGGISTRSQRNEQDRRWPLPQISGREGDVGMTFVHRAYPTVLCWRSTRGSLLASHKYQSFSVNHHRRSYRTCIYRESICSMYRERRCFYKGCTVRITSRSHMRRNHRTDCCRLLFFSVSTKSLVVMIESPTPSS